MGRTANLAERTASRRPALPRNCPQRLLAAARGRLAGGPAAAHLEAELLLAQAWRRPRSTLISRGEEPLAAAAVVRFRALLARRAAGWPMAYLLVEREFWSLPLRVNAQVLIPRPETELLVERALALLPRAHARVAELGTGSGAIALALASERPGWHLTATDRSEPALAVARGNARRLKLAGIEFLRGEWFAPLGTRRFHAILSNPPYVAASDAELRALRHEPIAALSPGPCGLEALRALIGGAGAHLLPGGWLLLEHGAGQAGPVAAALVSAGFDGVRCRRDLAGLDRLTEAQWRG